MSANHSDRACAFTDGSMGDAAMAPAEAMNRRLSMTHHP